MKAVFILGSGHSGSTLLDLLLDGHSQIVGVGEMHIARPESICTCGKPAREDPFWQAALGNEPWPDRELYRAKADFFRGQGPYRLVRGGAPVDDAAYREAIVAAYGRIARHSGASVVVDSSKSPERAELVSGDGSVDAVIIHLVRDGRAATWSYLRKYGKLWPYVCMWTLENLKVEILRRRFRGAYLLVRYEDLVEHPARELERICRLLGVAYEPAMLDFRAGEHHEIAGNRMRLGTDAAIRRDDAWRRDMPRFARLLFFFSGGWLNAWYQRRAVSIP